MVTQPLHWAACSRVW